MDEPDPSPFADGDDDDAGLSPHDPLWSAAPTAAFLSPDGADFALAADDGAAGMRLDVYLATALAGVSRSRIRRSIDNGLVLVDGVKQRASFKLNANACVTGSVPAASEGPAPEPTPLAVLFEDEHLAIIDKPPGMVVHPAKGHWAGTLASALVYRFNQLSTAGGAVRPGIVHRLDRDTSGVIVVAKHDRAHAALAQQFHDRLVQKEYLAIVAGRLDRDRDQIDQPIGPHPHNREKMAVRTDHVDARPAQTFYEVVERFPGFALVRALPKTGRTHQIRLHLAHAGAPVLCDRLYGGRAKLTLGDVRATTRASRLVAGQSDAQILLERQALHAHRLTIGHPVTGELLSISAPLPADLERVVSILREANSLR